MCKLINAICSLSALLHSPLAPPGTLGAGLSRLKLWRNWFGLRPASGLEAPEPSPPRLVRAISTSSTVIGWVWNLALLVFLRPRLETAGRQGEAEEGGGRLVRGVEGEAEMGEDEEEAAV